MFPSLVELKRISKSGIIVGHNGFGEFGIWDIAKRNLLSRFSSPGLSILECVPVSIFRWQCKDEHKTEEIVDEIMQATKQCLCEPESNANCIFSTEDDDMAIWLLISTVDHYSQRYHSSERVNLLGCWRLALLINNTVIIGSVIDPGAAAVTSAGHGIIGRSNGVVYEWDLFTGTKLRSLPFFEGSQVSCIATDSTHSGALAIASGCQLLVYLSS